MTKLLNAAAVLMRLGTTVGITQDQLQSAEDFVRLSLTHKLTPQSIGQLKSEQILDVAQTFGDSATLTFGVGGLEALQVSSEITESQVESLIADVRKAGEAEMRLIIDKSRMVRQFDWPNESRPFLFTESLCKLLRHGLVHCCELEHELWSDGTTVRPVIVIQGNELSLDGPFLAVISEGKIGSVNSTDIPEDEYSRSAQLRQNSDDAVRWDHRLHSLATPRWYRLSGNIPESATDRDVLRILLALWTNSCVASLADRVQLVGNAVIATVATEKSLVRIQLISGDVNATTLLETGDVCTLGDLVEWTYDERWESDRLRMAQVDVLRALAPLGEKTYDAALLPSRAAGIFEELKWHWKSFISDEVERFTEDERALEDEVAQAVESFDSQVAEMIKSLSGTMLAAVGILIASIIAAAIKGKFNPALFAFAVNVYLAYLLVFPGAYSMTHHVLRFIAASRVLDRRQSRFQRVLTLDVVESIVEPHVGSAKRRFWGCFGLTILAFAIVSVAFWMAKSVDFTSLLDG